MRITRKKLLLAAQDVVLLVRQYKLKKDRGERSVDRILFGLLEGRFGGIDRQHPVRIGKIGGTKRIDFRQRGRNPVLIEFAVANRHRACIYGPSNKDELVKLERFPPSQASTRYLLLLDVTGGEPLLKQTLQSSFDGVRGGRGNYRRHSVCVMYVHEEHSYCFTWWPE